MQMILSIIFEIFYCLTLETIERLSAESTQEKQGLRENHSARLCRLACPRTSVRVRNEVP